MRLKKAIKKMAAVGIGTTMLGATMFGAMADLSDYPSPFINDEAKFDGILVVGTGGSDPAGLAQDILGVTDIAVGLQTSATTSAGGSTTVTSVQGDSWRVGTSNKDFEVSEVTSTSTLNGENFNSQTSFIDDDDLDALSSGEVNNNKGSANYNQYLHFDSSFASTTATDTGYVVYTEDEDDVTADFLFFKSSQQIARYELEFTTSFEADIEDSAGTKTSTGTFLEDFEDEEITMLGREYTIVKARKPASEQKGIELTLFGGSEKLIMEEGETRTVTVGDDSYEVTVDAITDSGTIKAKFTVNGESTDSIVDGDTDKLSDGTEVGVTDIVQNEAGDVTADLVEFYIGAQKVFIKDSAITNGTGNSTLEVSDETIDGTTVTITGTDDGSVAKIDNIQIHMVADDDYYVANGETLYEEIVQQGDEGEALFTNNWDIEYLGIEEVDTEEIKIKSSGDDKYDLFFEDWGGNEVSVPLAYTVGGANVTMGDDDDALVINESVSITKNDYFIVSDVSKDDGERPTYAMRYKGSDKSTDDSAKMKLQNVGSGEDLEKTYTTSSVAEATFNIGGAQYKVRNTTSTESNDFSIQVDLNADGTYANEGAIAINTNAGAKIDLSGPLSSTPANQIDITVLTPDTDDYEDINPTNISFAITAASGEVDFAQVDARSYKTPEDEDNVKYTITSMGGLVTWSSPTSDPDELVVDYPKAQALPQVYITSGATETSVTGGAGTENVNINPIEGGFAKLDKDVSSAMIAANNVLSIGGSCVNSVSAEIMGLAAGTCGAASGIPQNKALIKQFENGDNVAMVVAGWTSEDTQRATRVLRYYGRYAADMVGSEVEVSGTTLSDISVGKPSPVAAAPVADETEDMADDAEEAGDDAETTE